MKSLLTKRNGIIAAIIAVVVIGAVILSTSLSSALTVDEAKTIAQGYVPATATFTTSEEEENKYEVYFYDSVAKESYEVEINKETKAVKKIETQLDGDLGGKTVKLTKAQAKQVAANKFPGITSSTATLTVEDGLYEYQVTFKANNFYGNMDVNAETGAILESVIKYGSAVTIPADQSGNTGLISYEKAMKAATTLVGGGTVKDIDLDTQRQNYVYEIEVIKDGLEYEVVVDATTGKAALEGNHENYMDTTIASGTPTTKPSTGSNNNSDSSNSGRISESKAKSIVLDKLPGASILYIQLERDDGMWSYEGEATKGEYEYEFEIDAESGIIIGWEKDRMEQYDHDDDDDDDDWDDDHDYDDDDHDDDWDDKK